MLVDALTRTKLNPERIDKPQLNTLEAIQLILHKQLPTAINNYGYVNT